jgi:hypothetical protein
MSGSPLTGAAGNWFRGPDDVFLTGDFDGDGRDELLLINKVDGWIGVARWNGITAEPGWALSTVWMSASPIAGPGGAWSLNNGDAFTVGDFDGDGQDEILFSNNDFATTGVMKWNGAAPAMGWGLQLVWMSFNAVAGTAGAWPRSSTDEFTAADVDGDGQIEILATVDHSNSLTGVLKWNGSSVGNGWALQAVWMVDSPVRGPGGNWLRGAAETYTAADVDNDGLVEIVVGNDTDGWTGLWKWT